MQTEEELQEEEAEEGGGRFPLPKEGRRGGEVLRAKLQTNTVCFVCLVFFHLCHLF